MNPEQKASEDVPRTQAFLEPVEVTNKVEVVIQRITHAILDGEFESGMQLPAERQFAESLGVSRAIVREAYSALEVAGMLERRSGSGSYIADVVSPAILRSRALAVIKSGADPYEVWAAREAIEPSLAEMFVSNVTDEELLTLESALNTLEDAIERSDWATYFEADQQFHMTLLGGTHNSSIIRMMESLIGEMRNPLLRMIKESYFLSTASNVFSSESVHRRIYESAIGRDADAYANAMREHFEVLRGIVEYPEKG